MEDHRMVLDGKPLVELSQVRFHWQRQQNNIVNIHHLVIYPGEKLFIKGASGSGKTTLLNLLGGIIVPQEGKVSVLDTALNELDAIQRDRFRAEHIGFIFQLFNLIPYLSLLENVTLPCLFSSARRSKALRQSETLEQEASRLLLHLGLEVRSLKQRPVTELSVGQQQRVACARALIGSPELIIADEPTSALDADTRHGFVNLLFREIAKEKGTTLLFVSHDSQLEPFFDRSIALPPPSHLPI